MSDIKIVTTAQALYDENSDSAKAFSLKRGEQVNLTRIDPSLRRIMVGIGWDVVGFENEAPDLDVSVFLLDKNNKTRTDDDFVFYNNLKTPDGVVEHMGDNRTGAGDGDDENIRIDIENMPFDVAQVEFVISIYEAEIKNQNFRSVRNCFLRIVNEETGMELMRFNLDDEFTNTQNITALNVGYLERSGPNWFFQGTGEMAEDGLKHFAQRYGIIIAH